MDLFDYMRSTNMEKEAPLAARMRPRNLDEVVGQQHIIGKDKLLYRAIKADKLSSIILYEPVSSCCNSFDLPPVIHICFMPLLFLIQSIILCCSCE